MFIYCNKVSLILNEHNRRNIEKDLSTLRTTHSKYAIHICIHYNKFSTRQDAVQNIAYNPKHGIKYKSGYTVTKSVIKGDSDTSGTT